MRKLALEEIADLYVNKRMSSDKIAEKYGCCKATILKRLKAAKVSIRASGVPKLEISDEELRRLYLGRRLSTWTIAELLKCGRSTVHRKLVKMGLARDVSASHLKYPRRSFSGSWSEKAYLLGFAIGDLRVRKVGKKSKTIKIDCGSTKREQIELIRSLFSKYGRVWISKPALTGKIQIEAFLDDSFDFLLDGRQKIGWAFHGRYFAPFLAGFTDAEGSIFITNGKAAYSLGNYDYELLEIIGKKLADVGISPARLYRARKKYHIAGGYRQRHHYWHLKISTKAGLLKLFNMLRPYIRHKKRAGDIQKGMKNISLRGIKSDR